ncbi:energy transducer TonB [Geomesophilobacter sediminis]|uniref:Energy transducer TonB n=1 Tax=Geomesophilobacter sediminis TaxID=2798584 RepID=A0A8J7JDC2_9BACT|nr:energy transducer TonB [Geomesophilobacter sediminis]MBJ6725078.1 energy transducer TonB [Geomesophilobacter sediminis]
MSQPVKCLGLSLMLHAVAVAFIPLLVSRSPERRPDPVLVVLESSLPTEVRPGRSVPATTPAKVRPATPRATGPDPVRNGRQTVGPRQAVSEEPAVVPVSHARPARVPPNLPEAPQPAASPAEVSAALGRATEISAAVVPGKESARASSREAGRGAPRHAAAPAPPAAAGEPQRYQEENYGYLRDRVQKHLEYPPLARRMRWSGRVVVSFTVGTDGNVDKVRVVESSGHAVLDQCATQAVRKAAPFRKPVRPAEIVLPVGFELK